MKRGCWVVMVVIMVLGAGPAVWGQSSSVLLEKGIYAEETVGNLDEAIKIYEQIISDSKSDRRYVAQAYYRLGMCYLKKGNEGKATEAFKSLLSQYPEQQKLAANAKMQLAKLKPVSQSPVSEADKLASERLSAKGWQLWNQRKLQEAEKTFEEAVEKNPANANAWNGLGWSRMNQGMPLNAKAAFEKCLTIEPKHPAALNGLGWIAKGEGKTDEAIKHWEKAVQATPYATAAISGLASTYMEQKQYNMAVKYYQMWLSVESNSIGAKKGLEEAEAEGGVYVEPKMDHPKKPEPLDINPAPWTDGEVMRLNMKTMAGMETGTMIWTADAVKVNGQDIWRIEQYMSISVNFTQQFSRVDAKKDSFTPIFGWTKNWMGDFQANYGKGKVELTTGLPGKKSTRQIPLNRIAYDNEQVLYLIRRLPLAEGYRASFPIFPVQGGTIVECRINVTGKENLNVSAGTFDCYKMDLAVYSQNIKALQHQLWFSADKHKYLVKYDSGAAVMELIEITKKQKGMPVSFQDKEMGTSLTAPAGWFFFKHSSPRRYKSLLELLPPELKAWALLSVSERIPGIISARTAADGDVAVLKGYFKNYTVRPPSWQETEISGLPTASYIADYEDKGKQMVEYRAYILGKSMVYWFVFRIEKDKFDANKPEFDLIIKSFRGN